MDAPSCSFQKLIILFEWETIKEYLVCKQRREIEKKNLQEHHSKPLA